MLVVQGLIAGTERLDPKGQLRQPYAGQLVFRHAREKMAVDWWAKYAAGPDFDVEGLQREARWLVRHHCCYALASVVQKWLLRVDEPALVVDTPASVLWGLADASHDATDKRSILRYLPIHQYHELERIGHFTDLEAIQTVKQEVERLLALISTK